jgi:hypothetical protein
MDQDNVDEKRLCLTDEAAARKKLDHDREQILAASPEDVARELESSLRQDDAGPPGRLRRIPRVLPVLHASRPGAEQRGMVGRQLPAQAVGFDLGGIAVPVLLLYGVRTCSCRPANG